MGLLLVVWICSLPFIGLVIAPLFGGQTAVSVAVALLAVMLILCWGRCIPMVVQQYRQRKQGSSPDNVSCELHGGSHE